MSFLNRQQLIELFDSHPAFVSDNQTFSKDAVADYSLQSVFQPCSIDIHVGELYVPETGDVEIGSRINPIDSSHSIAPGETVLIRTLESFQLPQHIGALCFSPSRLALKAVLITNTGHVDPGYTGKLHFTAINMGKDHHTFNKGDVVITMLFFKIVPGGPSHPEEGMDKVMYSGGSATIPATIKTFYPNLSKVFLNIDNRAREVAKQQITSERIWQGWVPLAVALVALGTAALPYAFTKPWEEDIQNFDQRMERVEDLHGYDQRLLDLEDAIKRRGDPTPTVEN